jgi:hypothetical protein
MTISGDVCIIIPTEPDGFEARQHRLASSRPAISICQFRKELTLIRFGNSFELARRPMLISRKANGPVKMIPGAKLLWKILWTTRHQIAVG